jgi:hypothetical protein
MRFFLLLVALLFVCGDVVAQKRDSLIIEMRDGSRVVYAVGEISKITFDSTTSDVHDRALSQGVTISVGTPSSSNINFRITGGTAGSLDVRIFDLLGQTIRRFSHVGPNIPFSLDWDLRDSYGYEVNSGLYFIEAKADGVSCFSKFAIAR